MKKFVTNRNNFGSFTFSVRWLHLIDVSPIVEKPIKSFSQLLWWYLVFQFLNRYLKLHNFLLLNSRYSGKATKFCSRREIISSVFITLINNREGSGSWVLVYLRIFFAVIHNIIRPGSYLFSLNLESTRFLNVVRQIIKWVLK